ncbi:nucleotide exchange factor GrpE [Nocardia higoensis]|uniref:nucleotide exchange factor GrpE n=1 Tax=Nocardia higoensis TaxID=228599 RepID=UPI0009FE5DC9|nr:nucleotide exchange factor GrpE [Nocardia higoensis]
MTEPGQRTEDARDRTPEQGESTIDSENRTNTAPEPRTDVVPGNGAEPESGTRATDDTAAALAKLAERVEDLSRIVARQAATIERLADEAKARDRRARAGADLPLVTELFALHGDTVTCARTAESDRDRGAFTALASRLERLLTGRGAALVAPAPGAAFDARTMSATDVVSTTDAAADRTVDALLAPGLQVGDRSVRPASVVVRRHRPAAT